MDFVSINEFVDDVMSEVPGCPIYTVRDKIRIAAIDFCKTTGVSVNTTYELDLDAGDSMLQVPSPSVSVVPWQVLWLKTSYGPVWPVGRRVLVDHDAEWAGLTAEYPTCYIRKSNTELQLIPTPTVNDPGVMTIHCSYIPARSAMRFDSVLLDEYQEAITHGALYRLLKMSSDPWYDRAESMERRDFFSIAQSEARALADKDFQTGEQMVQMSPMA